MRVAFALTNLMVRLLMSTATVLLGVGTMVTTIAHAQVGNGCSTTYTTCPAIGFPSVVVWTSAPSAATKDSVVRVFVSAHAPYGLDLTSYSRAFSSGASDLAGNLTNLSWASASMSDAIASSLVLLSPGSNFVTATVCDLTGPQCATDTLHITYDTARKVASSPSRLAPRVDTAVFARGIRSLGANAFESTLSYATPAYISRDTPHSVGLVYHASAALVTVPLQFEITDPSPSPAATLSLRIRLPNNSYETFYNSSSSTELYYTGGSGTIRMAGVVDASNFATGSYPRDAVITARWNDTTITTTFPFQLLVMKEQASVVGAGWTIAGLGRVFAQSNDAWVLADGAGGLTRFGWCSAPCTASNPPGVFDSLRVLTSVDADSGLYLVTTLRGDTIGYNPAGLQKYARDRFGNTTTFAYSSGRLSTITDAAGKTTTLAYSGGTLDSIIDPAGRVTHTIVDGNNNLTDVKDPDGRWALHNMTYSNHQLTQWEDRAGATWNAAYGADNTLSQIQAPTVTAEGGSIRPTTTFAGPHTSLLAPAASSGGTSGSPLSRISPDSARGLITSPAGTKTWITPTSLGVPIRVEAQSVGGQTVVSTTEFNSAWQATRITSLPTGATGSAVERVYDGAKLVMVRDVASGVETKSFHSMVGGVLVVDSVSINDNVVRQNFFSASGHPTRLDSMNNGVYFSRLVYDASGRVQTSTDHLGHVTNTRYLGSGFQNTDSVTAPGGRTTKFSYDGKGRAVKIRNPLGQVDSASYDDMNRPTAAIQRDTVVTRFGYDDAALRDTVTDAIAQQYITTRNVLGWVTSRVDPRGKTETYAYDRRGNVTAFTDRLGQTVTAQYDTLNRVRWRLAGGDTTHFAYDTAGRWMTASNSESIDTLFRDPAGRSSSAFSYKGSASYALGSTYDTDGARNQANLTAQGSTAASTHFGYDDLGRLSRIQNAAGHASILVYDTYRRLSYSTIPTTTNTNTAMWRQITYTAQDEPSLVEFTTNATTNSYLGRAYGYDSLGRVVGTMYYGIGGSTEASRSYTFDALGRITHYLDSSTWTPGWYWDCPNGGGYDECQIVWPDPVVDTVRIATYTYDKVGNRTDHSASIGTGNRLMSFDGFTMTYDSTGNMLTKNGNGVSDTLTWNPLGQLTQVRHNGYTATFGYDGLGRRVRKTYNGATTRYVYDGDHVVLEVDGSGGILRKYSYLPGMDHPYSVVISGSSYFYAMEQPGQVAGLVNSSGTMVNVYNYEPFGSLVSSTNGITQPLKFMGRELDETGYYYVRARYYDPALARFISEDPIGLGGGINAYSYAGNDPINNRDPSGACPEGWAWSGFCLLQKYLGPVVTVVGKLLWGLLPKPHYDADWAQFGNMRGVSMSQMMSAQDAGLWAGMYAEMDRTSPPPTPRSSPELTEMRNSCRADIAVAAFGGAMDKMGIGLWDGVESFWSWGAARTMSTSLREPIAANALKNGVFAGPLTTINQAISNMDAATSNTRDLGMSETEDWIMTGFGFVPGIGLGLDIGKAAASCHVYASFRNR